MEATDAATELLVTETAKCPEFTALRDYWAEMDRLAKEGKTGPFPEWPGAPHPRVGAIAFDADGAFLGAAHRGEVSSKPNDHAEFNLLTKIAEAGKSVEGGTVFTSLEPCTPNVRSQNKTACVERLVTAKPATVYIGMIDPNKAVLGQGIYRLQEAGIQVQLLDSAPLRELNAEFVKFFEKIPSDGVIAMRALMKACRNSWEFGLKAYMAGDTSGESLNNLAGAVRCFWWAAGASRKSDPNINRDPGTMPSYKVANSPIDFAPYVRQLCERMAVEGND